MNRKDLRREKGITLIALVITIIVMLILAAVSITLAVNGGLFGYAQEAKLKTENARDEEQNLGSGLVKVKDEFGNQDKEIDEIVEHYKVTS